MTFMDTLKLALSNLGQAKLRTFLTVTGVSIGIAALSCMLSFGVGLEDQLVSRFASSGMFDSIVVTNMPTIQRGLGRGRRGAPAGRANGRETAAGRQDAPPEPSPEPTPEPPRPRLDDEAIEKIAALPNVKSVHPDLRVPLQVTYKNFEELQVAAGVSMSSATDGAFQTFVAGGFFASESDDACMLSLEFARRVTTDDPKTLIGQALTLSYAMSPDKPASPPSAAAPVDPVPSPAASLPGLLGSAASLQIKRIDVPCRIVGIVERETAPGMLGGGAVWPLMIPLAKARAIDAVQVMSAQSLLRSPGPRGYNSVSVKVTGPQHTQDVQARIKTLGYSAFSLNDLLQGAKRAFLLLDIFLALVGSIALVVSSLGIINTMVMSILERTREIGIMKAIGGSDGNIRRIFLIEASAIGLIGGVGGIVIGWVVGRIINFAANWYVESQGGTAGDVFSMPFWLISGAIAFSVFVSLIAGSFPARRAARLDPIQALRHD
jgi:putative ABC transport system permease protein